MRPFEDGCGMKAHSPDQPDEVRRALDAPLFADVAGDVEISFEFFPPKTEKMDLALWETVQTLAPLGPRFVSVTYGFACNSVENSRCPGRSSSTPRNYPPAVTGRGYPDPPTAYWC